MAKTRKLLKDANTGNTLFDQKSPVNRKAWASKRGQTDRQTGHGHCDL